MLRNVHRVLLRWIALSLVCSVTVVGLRASVPTDGLVVHLDAASLTEYDNNARMWGGWDNLVTTQPRAFSNQPPRYRADGGDGYPTVRFNGTNQFLRVETPLGSDVTVFVVYAYRRDAPVVNTPEALIAGSGEDGVSFALLAHEGAGSIDYPHLEGRLDAGGTAQIWLNGWDTEEATGDYFVERYQVASAVYTGVQPAEDFVLSAVNRNADDPGQNDIREVLVYNRLLTERERMLVQRHLGRKYDMEVVSRPLEHPVEERPHVLASQQFGTQYSFGEGSIRTLDYARQTLRQGSRVVKFRLSNRYDNVDGFTFDPRIDTLTELVRDQPEVREIFEMPMTDYIFWVSSFSVPQWQSRLDSTGLNDTAETSIYNEVYDLASYLLTTYSGTGKRFYLGNWEGDWMLSGNFRSDPTTIPANRIQGMIEWANVRQRAVADARRDVPHEDVDVWFFLEMNKADWMREGLPCVANSVIPAMPQLDMISISSYSVHKFEGGAAPTSRMHSDLDQVQALIDNKPDAAIPGSRLMIGEYGFTYSQSRDGNINQFTRLHIDTLRSYFSWQGGTLRFILQWQFYNQAVTESGASKNMSQIGPDNDLRPMYYLHENYYREMSRWVDDYYSSHGELPTERAYSDQVVELLDTLSIAAYEPQLNLDSYTAWRAYHFPDSAEVGDDAVSGPLADPQSTGLPHFVRYALGLDRFGSDAATRPLLVSTDDGMWVRFRYMPERTDVRLRVEAATTPGVWNRIVFDSASTDLVPTAGWLEVDPGEAPDGDAAFYRFVFDYLGSD